MTIGRRIGPGVLTSLALSAALALPANATRPGVTELGSGAQTVWILWPLRSATSIVVFGHGWSTPVPAGFGPWIAHLRARGSIVIYPRYVEPGESVQAALLAFESGLREAFDRIGPTRLPVVAVGKSFGGSAVFYYAGSARSLGLPPPEAILSVFPALPLGTLPARLPAPSTFVEFLVGDADTIAGSAGADEFWRWLADHPQREKRYVVVHSRPGFVADHDSAQRSDRIARAVFWAPFDRLIERAVRSS